jgi:hypothetical protein
MKLFIKPKKIMTILMALVVMLAAASVTGQIYKYHGGHDRYLVSLFNLDEEWNMPTWYAATSLMFCSLLLAIISIGEKQDRSKFSNHWTILSIIFLLLAMDEAIQIHEQTITPLRTLLKAEGILYFTWVLPAAILLILFGLTFLKFFFNLPKATRLLFLVSGCLYVGGALGMELIGGFYAETYGQANMGYAMLTNFEEFTVLSYIGTRFEDFRIETKKY